MLEMTVSSCGYRCYDFVFSNWVQSYSKWVYGLKFLILGVDTIGRREKENDHEDETVL